jgi:GR25 family glycosyltransferase involved in LPS biosynthesis
VKLIQPSPILLRTSAQLVSYATAVTLLENTKKFDRPIDGMLQMHWFTGVSPVCIVPSGVTDRTHETGGSTLSIKKSNIISLYRIIQRIIYRIKIRNYSKIIRVNTSKDQIDDLHTN